MDVVGFDSHTQVTILKLVSAILHLGNVQFNEESNVAVPVSDNCEYQLLSDCLLLSFYEYHWR